jgi:hypothetical protein
MPKVEVIPLSNDEIYAPSQSKLVLKLNENEDGESSSSEIKRANWSNRVEFLLACVGYSVG